MDSTLNLLQDSLMHVWNNRNPVERRDVMKKIYAPDIEFFENKDSAPFVGIEALHSLIDKLQLNWPPDFEFKIQKPVETNHNVQHVSWTLGPAGQPAVAKGMDIAIIDGDRIKALYLFLATNAE